MLDVWFGTLMTLKIRHNNWNRINGLVGMILLPDLGLYEPCLSGKNDRVTIFGITKSVELCDMIHSRIC